MQPVNHSTPPPQCPALQRLTPALLAALLAWQGALADPAADLRKAMRYTADGALHACLQSHAEWLQHRLGPDVQIQHQDDRIVVQIDNPYAAGDDRPTPAAARALEALAALLGVLEPGSVEISTHTASAGRQSDNLAHSHRRARKLAGELLRQGVEAHRIAALGEGERDRRQSASQGQPREDARFRIIPGATFNTCPEPPRTWHQPHE